MRVTLARVTLMTPRHEPHSGGKYDKLVALKLNEEGLEHLDRLRKKLPRSVYLRGLLKKAVAEDKEKVRA